MGRPRRNTGRRGVVAERLRAARRALGITQEQAARELGVATATLGRWEAGLKVPGVLAQMGIDRWLAKERKGGRDGS